MATKQNMNLTYSVDYPCANICFWICLPVVIDIKNKRRPAKDDERQAHKMIMAINSSTKLVLKKHKY